MQPLEARVERTLEGRVLTSSGRPLPDGTLVWFAYRLTDGGAATVQTTTDKHGRFVFDLPTGLVSAATVGVAVDGTAPVDLEPDGAVLEPGDVVLFVDDVVPFELRYGCV